MTWEWTLVEKWRSFCFWFSCEILQYTPRLSPPSPVFCVWFYISYTLFELVSLPSLLFLDR